MCQCAKFDQFLPARSHFGSKRPENCVRIAKFPYAAFGPLFAFHCPLFFTRNNELECKSSRFAAVDHRSVGDKQLHLNGVIHSAGVKARTSSTLLIFSPICHLHMPNLHIKPLKHVHANELYIWQTRRKSNTHIVMIFGMLINNTTVIRMTQNWKAAGIL